MSLQPIRRPRVRHPDITRTLRAVADAGAAVYLDRLALRCLLIAFARAAGVAVPPRLLGAIADDALALRDGAPARPLHVVAA